jgi:mRNA interferase MazF
METSAIVHPGEIYWALDPAAIGSEQQKSRPWIVMSRKSINGGNTVVVVPLTSGTDKSKKYPAFCIILPAGEIITDIGQKPSIDSTALCHQVRVLDKTRFTDRYGKLSLSAIPAVQLGLSYVFNI